MNAPYYFGPFISYWSVWSDEFNAGNSLSFLWLYFFSGLVAGHVSFSYMIIWIVIFLI